ncbi:putative E3 ubiquitin ligase SUD1 isoform X2 [Tasmannia lanceolata]|uniref:putative E3 ubiquitin ligase SUD1 isoform X2 n=1 Tax=Tasmannia lanceolata TaxID=3420 RepID=UPI0040645A7D
MDIAFASSSSSSSPSAQQNENPSHNKNKKEEEEEEEEEENICRICRNPGNAENPLRYPCACNGTIKFVHQECLLQWLNHSNAKKCEVCKHTFSFSPVYTDNAPARLPFREFIVGMAMKACHFLQFSLRLTFVLSVWLLIIPFITFWIWRSTFVRSLGEAQKLLFSHISANLILTDCLHGLLLSSSIVLIFLVATYLRDHFRHHREPGGGQDRRGARAVRRPPALANRIRAGNGQRGHGGEGHGIAGVGQMIIRNAENIVDWLEIQAARLEAHVEQMFDGLLDDADGAEDVPFVELVGMQGPAFHLVEHAIFVLASNAIFIGVVISVPFSLGRLALYYISWFFSSSNPVISVLPSTELPLSLANNTVKSVATAIANLESLKVNTTGLEEASNNLSHPLAFDLLKGPSIGASGLSDVTTLAIGYMFIFCMVFCYLNLVALIRYARGEPFTMGRLYGIASIAEAIPPLIKQFLAGMKHLMTMVKVVFLLVIELGVFPMMCGWWLDVCTIKMFGTTIAQRVEFFSVSPLASSLIHWLVGIAHLLEIGFFIRLLREVLRNGVIHPANPNYNPFRDLIDDPVHKHARRALFSGAVCGCSSVLVVFIPVKLSMRLAPSIFPLDISFSDPLTEIPADMLLFQVCIPFAIKHFKLRATIKSLLRHWFTVAGWALGLTDFLLPGPEDNGGQENSNVGPARQDRLRDIRHDGVGQQDRALDVANKSNGVDEADTEYGFVLRIVLLLVLAWMTLLLFNSCSIVVPISLGRALFNAISRLPISHDVKFNDLFAFKFGLYIIWTALTVARYSIELVKTRRVWDLVTEVWKWCAIVFKSSALLSLWVMLDDMAPLVDESWKTNFQRVRDDGFSRLQGLWVLREIVIPIMVKLLTFLCVPYVFARGLFPALGYPLIVNSAVYRFSWLGCLFFSIGYFCAKRFHVWFTNLHNSMRDDHYLIGRRLHDFGEDTVEKRNNAKIVQEMQETRGTDAGPGPLLHEQEVDVGLRLRRADGQNHLQGGAA